MSWRPLSLLLQSAGALWDTSPLQNPSPSKFLQKDYMLHIDRHKRPTLRSVSVEHKALLDSLFPTTIELHSWENDYKILNRTCAYISERPLLLHLKK